MALDDVSEDTFGRFARFAKSRAIPSKQVFLILVSFACVCTVLCPLVLGQTVTAGVTFLRSYGSPLKAPVRLAVDSADRLYVADSVTERITVRDKYGRLNSVSPKLKRPLGIAVDATGLIYVAEEGRGSVTVFNPDWTVAAHLGSGDGEFVLPNHIALDPSGAVYVADSGANVVKKYLRSGQLALTIGTLGTGDGQFGFPTGVAISGSGELFVADQQNCRLQVFATNGKFLRKIVLTRGGMLGTTGLGRLQGITIDGSGRAYVADTFLDYIRVLTTTGTNLTSIGTLGTGPGQLMNPSSVVFDQNNRLFVASLSTGRVEAYGVDSYSDPHLLAANFSMQSITLPRGFSAHKDSRYVTGSVKIPGYAAKEIVRDTVLVNGAPVRPAPGGAIGDFDGDGVLEYGFLVDRAVLLNYLYDGEAVITISGVLNDGTEFYGEAMVLVEPAGDVETTASLQPSVELIGGTR